MADLINFVTLLNGKFDNKDQFEKISKTNPQYPYAKHINTICNSKLNSLSYILFSLGGTGSYIVFFVDPNGWAQTMLGNGTEQSYIDTMQATAKTGILIAMFVAVIITSAISAFVGCKMLKKQFEKAGITA